MADYRETVAEALAWRRAKGVTLDNPLTGAKTVTFTEEDVVTLNGTTFNQPVTPVGAVRVEFNPEGVFPLVNPATGDEIGQTANHIDLYVMLHSLYIHLAKQRDVTHAANGMPG
jgi:hypothetical protein